MVDFPLFLSDGLGSLTSALPVFSSSPGFEGFSSHQGARAATSLLSQPLLPIQHAHTHADFHFSNSARLAAPPPQGWLKTGGQTSSSVGGMHAGEKLPEDLFEAALDSIEESSKHRRGLFRMSCDVECQFVVKLTASEVATALHSKEQTMFRYLKVLAVLRKMFPVALGVSTLTFEGGISTALLCRRRSAILHACHITSFWSHYALSLFVHRKQCY